MANNYNSTLQSNNTDLQAILNTINELPEAGNGVELPTLTNEGSASDLLSGKELIDGDGNVVTGTIPTKTSSNLTVSGATVTVPSGYYSAQATKAVTTATQATPSVTINSSTGLITATATQTAGYVTAGSKSGTLQLAFQAAQTITPGTTNKTIAANTYLGGVQTIKGDANLVASNIVSGKSIFGVVGTATAGDGGDTSAEDAIVTGTLTSYTNDRVVTIGSYVFYAYSSLKTVNFPAVTFIGSSAFYGCYALTTASFPVATSIGSNAFLNCYFALTTANFPKVTYIGQSAFAFCSKLTTASFPEATYIESYAFFSCSKLTTASFPKATSIGRNALYSCSALTTASFPKCTTIGSYAFQNCYNLKSLYLTGSKLCVLSNSNAFASTPIGGYSRPAGTYGSIYVPTSLLTSYQTATNWAYFSSRFVGI